MHSSYVRESSKAYLKRYDQDKALNSLTSNEQMLRSIIVVYMRTYLSELRHSPMNYALFLKSDFTHGSLLFLCY